MSNYIFSPSPNFNIGTEPYVFWENGFTDDEINEIVKIGECRTLAEAKVGQGENGRTDSEYRRSKTSWIEQNSDSSWLYDRIAYIVRQLNGQYYRFDLYGFCEDMQFTIYEGDDQGYYDWHLDNGAGDMSPRKLSFVLQLSDPEEYEGGELQIMNSKDPLVVKKQKGLAVVFPSYMLHTVTPVTKGIRKSLVVWVTGPAFR